MPLNTPPAGATFVEMVTQSCRFVERTGIRELGCSMIMAWDDEARPKTLHCFVPFWIAGLRRGQRLRYGWFMHQPENSSCGARFAKELGQPEFMIDAQFLTTGQGGVAAELIPGLGQCLTPRPFPAQMARKSNNTQRPQLEGAAVNG